jgi:hypothetical protein
MLGNLLCRCGKHRINRHRVWHDGVDFRSKCTRCGLPMVRDFWGWREFDATRDGDFSRQPHPRQRKQSPQLPFNDCQHH